MAVDWTGTSPRHACCWRPGTHAAGHCGPFSTATPTLFWPALTPGASGTTSGHTRRGTTRRTLNETTTTPAGERVAPDPQFPHGIRNATTTYASSASTDVAAYDDLPSYHLQAARNLIATDEELYHGSDSELPPA
jgi:hypothetical protein